MCDNNNLFKIVSIKAQWIYDYKLYSLLFKYPLRTYFKYWLSKKSYFVYLFGLKVFILVTRRYLCGLVQWV